MAGGAISNKQYCRNESLADAYENLVEHGVPGRADTVLVIGDSQLIIDFANRVACPSKAKLFLGV